MEGLKRPVLMRTWYSASLVLEGIIRLPSAAKADNLEAAFFMLLNFVKAVSMALDVFVFGECL